MENIDSSPLHPAVSIRTLPSYFRTAWIELKKVSWPTRKETFRNTWVVILLSVFFGLFLGALDYGLNRLLQYILQTIS